MLSAGQVSAETHKRCARADLSGAMLTAHPMFHAPRKQLDVGHCTPETHTARAYVNTLGGGHALCEAQTATALPNPRSAGHGTSETQPGGARASTLCAVQCPIGNSHQRYDGTNTCAGQADGETHRVPARATSYRGHSSREVQSLPAPANSQGFPRSARWPL